MLSPTITQYPSFNPYGYFVNIIIFKIILPVLMLTEYILAQVCILLNFLYSTHISFNKSILH